MPRTLESQITLEKTPSYFVTQEAPRRAFTAEGLGSIPGRGTRISQVTRRSQKKKWGTLLFRQWPSPLLALGTGVTRDH